MNATTVSNITPAGAYEQYARAEATATTAIAAWEAVVTSEWAQTILATADGIGKVNGETAVILGMENNADGVRSAQAVYSVAVLSTVARGGASVAELAKALKKGFATNSASMVDKVAYYGKTKSDRLTWASFIQGAAALAKPEGAKRTEDALAKQSLNSLLKHIGAYTLDQTEQALKALAAHRDSLVEA